MNATEILRECRREAMLRAIHRWSRSTGRSRRYWRHQGLWTIREFRQWHLEPERRAFEEAIKISQGGNIAQ